MGDEYEYACQLITADGQTYPLSRYDWHTGIEYVKLLVEQSNQQNAVEEAKNGKNGMTFRLVRRRKAGPVEVVDSEAENL